MEERASSLLNRRASWSQTVRALSLIDLMSITRRTRHLRWLRSGSILAVRFSNGLWKGCACIGLWKALDGSPVIGRLRIELIDFVAQLYLVFFEGVVVVIAEEEGMICSLLWDGLDGRRERLGLLYCLIWSSSNSILRFWFSWWDLQSEGVTIWKTYRQNKKTR